MVAWKRAWLVFAVALVCTAAEAAPAMSREDFQKEVFRGLPGEKLVELLGEPESKQPSKRAGIQEWTYRSQIIGKRSIEPVTVMILVDYNSVESIRWADGTTSE